MIEYLNHENEKQNRMMIFEKNLNIGRVQAVRFNEEGTIIFSASIDGTVKIWDIKSREYDPIQILDDAKDSVTSISLGNHEILDSK